MIDAARTLNDWSIELLAALWRASWQGGLALLLVFAVCRAVRRPSQALRRRLPMSVGGA